MGCRLEGTQNWKELALQANWSAATLAEKCGVSLRTLERHFLKVMGKHPQTWLCELRQSQAVELLRDGCNVKETAKLLGYKHGTHFSREFKKHWGHAPTTKTTPSQSEGNKCRVLV